MFDNITPMLDIDISQQEQIQALRKRRSKVRQLNSDQENPDEPIRS